MIRTTRHYAFCALSIAAAIAISGCVTAKDTSDNGNRSATPVVSDSAEATMGKVVVEPRIDYTPKQEIDLTALAQKSSTS